jgi:hypothetical protein
MSTKYSDTTALFRSFRNTPHTDFHFMIRFFKQNNDEITKLPVYEQLTIKYYYAQALFQLEHYKQFILIAEQILESSVLHNISLIDSFDFYQQTLYQKAHSHLELKEYQLAHKFTCQALKLAPQSKLCKKLLRRCIFKNSPKWLLAVLAFNVFNSFASILLFLFEQLVADPIYPNLLPIIHSSLQVILAVLFLSVLFLGVYYYRYVTLQVRKESQRNNAPL